MKKPLKQFIKIDSQSDIDSDSSNQIMELQSNSRPQTLPIPRQDMYQKFTSSQFYLLTESLKKYAYQISDFLQMRKNVLFIFGPSGCGKATLVNKVLRHNNILYDLVEQHEDQNERMISLQDSILETLKKIDSRRVHLCFDFPIHLQKWNFNEIRDFKTKFLQQIKRTTTKIIFILNEQIYSSFYILNERASSEQNINNRDNVSVIKMQKFGVLEMKKILKAFVDYQKLHNYVTLGKQFLDEVVELSNGDLRKALYMLYWKGIEGKAEKILKQQQKRTQFKQNGIKFASQYSSQSTLNKGKKPVLTLDLQQQPKPHSFSLRNDDQQSSSLSLLSLSITTNKHKPIAKNYEKYLKNKSLKQARFSLYHGLGKLLYGKRLNIKTQAKNKKQIACYYSQKQIKQLDPPFYFDPVGLFQQLRIDLDIVTKLLQQNYLERYGKIKDISKMSQIFAMQDGFFTFKNKVQDEEVNQLKVLLLTWGILIYNRNSRTDNMGFKKIEKSQSANVSRKVSQKKRLLKQYFPQSHPKALISFAHHTRSLPSILNDTIFNKSLSRPQVSKFDDHTKKIQNQEEQQQLQTVMKMTSNEIENKLRQMTKDKQKKQKQMLQLLNQMEEEDDENVAEISDSDSNQ